MAKNQSLRLKPAQIIQNTNAFFALKVIAGYTPSNINYKVTPNGQALFDTMNNARGTEAQAEAALKTARDNANKAEWDMHNFMLGAKDQVIAQYGKDSNELQSLGLKKKSEYKSPSKKTVK